MSRIISFFCAIILSFNTIAQSRYETPTGVPIQDLESYVLEGGQVRINFDPPPPPQYDISIPRDENYPQFENSMDRQRQLQADEYRAPQFSPGEQALFQRGIVNLLNGSRVQYSPEQQREFAEQMQTARDVDRLRLEIAQLQTHLANEIEQYNNARNAINRRAQRINQINRRVQEIIRSDYSQTKKQALLNLNSIKLTMEQFDGELAGKLNIVRAKYWTVNESNFETDTQYSFLNMGASAFNLSVNEHKAGNSEDAKNALELSNTFLDIALGMTPFVGTFKDGYEAASGKNLITGATLTEVERTMAGVAFGAGLATGGFGAGATKFVRALIPRSQIAQNIVKTGYNLGLRLKNEFIAAGKFATNVLGNEIGSVGRIEDVLIAAGRENIQAFARATDEIAAQGKEISSSAQEYLSKQILHSNIIRGGAFETSDLVRIGLRYDDLAARIVNVTPIQINEIVWRGMRIPRDQSTITNLFETYAGSLLSNHRFSMPGELAVYTTIGNEEIAKRTILREIGAASEETVFFASKEVRLDRVLDLTDENVLKQLDLNINLLTREQDSAMYDLTHIIGNLARQNGYSGIKSFSAKNNAVINLIFWEQ